MCGRVVQARPLDVLAELFDASCTPRLAGSYKPAWNIPPTQPVVGLTAGWLDLYTWGLAGRFFNARAETASVRERRLAVVVDGFFEWKDKRPLFIQRADGRPLTLAGLWAPWRAETPQGELEAAATVITTAAGPDLEPFHDRQPVVLEADGLERWLAPEPMSADEARRLLVAGAAGVLTHHPVDPRVGDVRNDGPDLIAPFAEPEELRLFT